MTERGHSDYVRAVSWSPDGTMLASGSDDKTIILWDVQSGKVNSTLTVDSLVRAVAFSPGGSKIAAAHSKKVQIFDAHAKAKLGSPLSGHADCVRVVPWSPDGTMLASGSDDKTIKLWNAHSGKEMSELSGHSQGQDFFFHFVI